MYCGVIKLSSVLTFAGQIYEFDRFDIVFASMNLGHSTYSGCLLSPYGIGQTIIFSSCGFLNLSSSSFFPRLSAVGDWMSDGDFFQRAARISFHTCILNAH